jgi:SAM-dependent methyltransferase
MNGTTRTGMHWEDKVYTKGFQVNRWPYHDVISTFKRLVAGSPRRSLKVLEVGCGTGNNLWFFAEEGHDVHGLDISPSAIGLARQHLESLGLEAGLGVSDLSTLPYDDATFDLTLDRECLSCLALSRLPGTIGELYRVLKPGGVHLSFSLYGDAHPDKQAGEEVEPGTFGRFTSGRLARSGHITFLTPERIGRLFARYSPVSTKRTCSFDGETLLTEEYSVIARKG